ncbi:hypothetical protein GCM10008083_18530 [Ulvibacter litoralis]|nr:hypothetical protein GCM10008083_18530 [Ulvibacter litoralis]
MGDNNPVVYGTNRAVQQTHVSTETNASAVSLISLGEEYNATFNGAQEDRQVFNSSSDAKNISANGANRNAAATQNILMRTAQMDEELQAAAIWRATNPATTSSRAVGNNMPSANLLADFIPTAGATETFTPAVGDHFFDPGGPGGSSTGGSPGNYPNCDCDTVTTLAGVTEIEFLDFGVFATFDYVRIYDGVDTSGAVLYDNSTGGANQGDITLGDMIASNGSASIVGTSGALTFFFHASGVVDYGGWDAEIIALSAPVVFPAPYCGPLDFVNNVEPITLVDVAGISNVSDATVGGSPAHEDFTLIVGAMEEGMTYPILLEGNTNGNFTNRFAVFIDWNQNDVLDDAGEVYEITELLINSTGVDGIQVGGDIVVPAGVTAGDTRMRVKKIFGTTDYLDPCLGTGFGQAEDYTITVTASGGGGGGTVACTQEHPLSAVAAGGMGSSVDSDFKTASDIVILAGEDFTIDTIDTYFLTFAPSDPPTTANVVYYEDAGGFPGAVLGSETVVPTILNAQPWVNPVADQYEITMAVTPFTFAGDPSADTTYWIEVSMGTATNQATVFWEYTNDTPVEGSPAVQFDATLGTWSIPDPTQEVVYVFAGECSTSGGGSTIPCNEENLSNAFENALFSGTGATAPAQVIATDMTIAADTDFSLTTVNANLWIRGMGESITAADIVIYGDAAGFPDSGNIIASYPAVAPTSETVLGTAFTDFEVLDVTFDIPATMLAGQAGATTTYWVSIYGTASNADDVLWESTTASTIGNEGVFSVDNAATWTGYVASDMVYNFSGDCTTTGGGGGATCEASNPGNAFENGFFNNEGGAFTTANDLIVSDGEQFEMNQVTLYLFHDVGATISNVNFFYYDNVGTLPGTLIGSEMAVVPTSQVVVGNNFGFDVSEVVLDITPFVFAGVNGSDTTYWVETTANNSAAGITAWEATSASYIGNPSLSFDIANSTWIPQVEDGVYKFTGDCTALPPDPTYDTCDGARTIMCGETVVGSTIGATEDSAVAPTCDTTVTAPGVWYKYEDTSGLVTDITVTMCEGTTAYDTKLSVYTGDCGAPPFTCVAGNDDSCGLQSEVTFQSDGATTFYILVHGFGTSTGDFELTMNCTPVPPPNDMIANSIDVDEAGYPYVDPAVAMPAATTEAGTPSGCDNAGAKGVWYNFVPVADGEATAKITSPAGVSSVTFYTAPNENSTETDLVLVDWYLNQCLPGTEATIPTVAGQAYYVYVVNHGGITDIEIDGDGLGLLDNTIQGFSFYPNPAETTINLDSVDTIESVAIFNMLGQKVVDQTINATTSQVDISKLATGTYLLQVSVNGQRGTYKILKN